jgi:hypothetical protein
MLQQRIGSEIDSSTRLADRERCPCLQSRGDRPIDGGNNSATVAVAAAAEVSGYKMAVGEEEKRDGRSVNE